MKMNANIKRILSIGSLVAAVATTGCASLTASTEGYSEQETSSASHNPNDIMSLMRDTSQGGGE
jgi:hypothetical protein